MAHCLFLSGPQAKNGFYRWIAAIGLMRESTNFEAQLSEMLSPPERILFFSLIGLYYQKKVLNYHYILNFVNNRM